MIDNERQIIIIPRLAVINSEHQVKLIAAKIVLLEARK